MISTQNNNSDTSFSNFNLKKTVMLYLKKWPWFVVSCIICFAIAFIKLRYTAPQYVATSKIMILDENERNAEAKALKGLSSFSENEDAKLEDEILIIKSRGVLQSIVKKLHLNIQFFVKGRIFESELYNNSPVEINFISTDSVINNTGFSFYVDVISETEFNYRINEGDLPKKIVFGEKIPSHFGGFTITPKTNNIKSLIGGNGIRVSISPVDNVARYLKNNIFIFSNGKSSKVLTISMQDPNIQKARHIIDALVKEYDNSTILKMKERSERTAKFIENRVASIALDLQKVDDSIVGFKTNNKVTDVTSEASQFLSSNVINNQQLDLSRTQLRQLNYIEKFLQENNNYNQIPSNLGMEDASINALSSRYNEQIVKRESLLKSAGDKNPMVLAINETINGIRENLKSSIQNSKNSLGIQISSFENQSNKLNSKILSVPIQQSKLKSIERSQLITENLFLYLLQRKEEALISGTEFSSKVKVIENASSFGGPVSPNNKMAYISALFLGLFFPFLIIYISDLLDTKIHNKEDLEKEIKDISILGEIPRVKTKQGNALVKRNDRSILSESFRIIRTNFDYVQRGKEVQNYNNVIFVTSTINSEGKSFFSMNMAMTFANTDKRVLVIGADIRNPKIFPSISVKANNISKVGLTEFLVDKSILVGEAINTYEINGNKIDVLLSGKVPPNPAELLMSDRMKPLFDKVSEQYDYVIVDTAPSMLVTDTLLFSQYAGHTVYLTRAGYTEKRILNFAKILHADKKLNGMMLVVNDVKQSNFGYGAKYGYYGAKEKKSIFKRRKA